MENETWFDIPDFEGYYQYSDKLRIKSLKRIVVSSNGVCRTFRERIILPAFPPNNYALVQLSKNNKKTNLVLHIFFAKAFIPNPNNHPIVLHLNDNKHVFELNNLRWGTYSDNTQDMIAKGRQVSNSEMISGVLNVRSIKVIDKSTGRIFDTIKDAANSIGLKDYTLSRYLKGTRKNKTTMATFTQPLS